MVLQIDPQSRRLKTRSWRERQGKKRSRPIIIDPPALPSAPIAPWQAWALALWMVLAAGAYVVSMLL